MSNLKQLLHVMVLGFVTLSVVPLVANDKISVPDTDECRPCFPPEIPEAD
jgi:hypothetical protein